MKSATRISAMTIATLLAVTAPAALLAQAAPEAPTADVPAMPTAQDVSSAELDAFVLAYEGVVEIDAEYAPQVAEETDPEAQQLLLQEAQVAMVEIVEQTEGIDETRYMEILTLAQTDAELSSQIVARLEQ